jgi:hypothetical protein
MKQIRQLVKEKDRTYTNQSGERRRKPNDAIRNAAEVTVKLSEMCRQGRLRQWGHFKRLPPTSTISKALRGEAPTGSGLQVIQKRSWLQLLEEDISTRQNPETGNPLTIRSRRLLPGQTQIQEICGVRYKNRRRTHIARSLNANPKSPKPLSEPSGLLGQTKPNSKKSEEPIH